MFGKGRFGIANPMFGKKGEKCHHWKGGTRKRPDGYVRIVAPDSHPSPSEIKRGTKYILEHRLVMEKKIGRYLTKEEVVHHIDSNPSNNSPDNLMLFANSAEHTKHHNVKVI
jgi:hypothetical protein